MLFFRLIIATTKAITRVNVAVFNCPCNSFFYCYKKRAKSDKKQSPKRKEDEYEKVYVLLEPNGDVKFLVKNKMMSLWDMCNLIDCRMIDESDVQINFPFKSTILFDDEFGLKRNNKMNLLASVLYGYTTNHMQTLYGNVILQKE